jgi:DMSO/TMAO reductase YedYZ molybdopterin-dependent catalytic subunit
MTTPRVSWGTAGIIAGLSGLAVSHGTTHLLGRRLTPFNAVAEFVIEHTPGPIAHWIIDLIGNKDKPLLRALIAVTMLVFFLAAGRLAERAWWAPLLTYLGLGAFAGYAAVSRFEGEAMDLIPVVAGVVTWIVVLSLLTDPLRREQLLGDALDDDLPTRRSVLLRAGIVSVAALGVGVFGEVLGRNREEVERARRLLNLPITDPPPPPQVRVGLEGVARWQTRNNEFYKIDTVIVVPAIDPNDWRLRIHGMVDRELVISYQDLLDRQITEDWITLNCVSNEVGGDLIGNAWWSGVRIAPLLAQLGVSADADCVLQTSEDGWTCATPLAALTDDRNAMIALAMNGEPLPLDHGFPARMIVPGLYGYVSACKWLIDIEVTRFEDVSAFWTERGWSEEGPVKIGSRVDVPASGDEVSTGSLRVGGMAWSQHTGIAAVEYALDGGAWERADIGGIAEHRNGSPNDDTWVQWAASVEVDDGDHELRVRAIGKGGEVQTGVVTDVLPDGATGHHTIEFSAS